MIERRTAVVDSSVLYASVDTSDAEHARCVATLRAPGFRLVYPTLILCEVLHLIGQRMGSHAKAMFLRSLEKIDFLPPQPDEWSRISELVQTYRNLPLGGVDASIIVLAERFNTDTIITLDRRHFSVVRPRHTPAFRILHD